jgi:hypothetical protein
LKIHQLHQEIQEHLLLNKLSHGVFHTQELELQSQFAMELMLALALKPLRLLSIDLEDLSKEQHQEIQTTLRMHQHHQWFQSLATTFHHQVVILLQLLLSKCHGVQLIKELEMLLQSATVEMTDIASKQLKLLNTD